MSQIFILAIVFVFLTILIESISLILQLKGKKITKWLGKNAFIFHASITGVFWIISVYLIIVIQFEAHPLFHNIIILNYLGLVLLVIGGVLALWAFKLLGIRRALCVNFFEDNVLVVRSSLYKYIKNPLDIGFWTALIGFALFTGSFYNLVIAVEFIIIMYPHMLLENKKIS